MAKKAADLLTGNIHEQVERMQLYLAAWLRQRKEQLQQQSPGTSSTPIAASDLSVEEDDDDIFG